MGRGGGSWGRPEGGGVPDPNIYGLKDRLVALIISRYVYWGGKIFKIFFSWRSQSSDGARGWGGGSVKNVFHDFHPYSP